MSSVAIAEAYYTALGEKDMGKVEKYLHPEVNFIAPLGKVAGKEAFLEAAKGFVARFKSLKIRSKFGTDDQAVIVYDLECPAPVGNLSTAVLMTFKEGLIAKIELFFDPRPFEQK